MKTFLKKMMSTGDEVSSKRVLSIVFTAMYIGVIIISLFGIEVSDTIIWSLVGLITAGFGFTAIEKFN